MELCSIVPGCEIYVTCVSIYVGSRIYLYVSVLELAISKLDGAIWCIDSETFLRHGLWVPRNA